MILWVVKWAAQESRLPYFPNLTIHSLGGFDEQGTYLLHARCVSGLLYGSDYRL
jgi:hypothetical protein